MRKIVVRHEGYPVRLIDDEWRCTHENVEVQAPCCSSRGSSGYIECGCQGQYNVYCEDCQNDDMRDDDVERIITNYLRNEMRDYDEYN